MTILNKKGYCLTWLVKRRIKRPLQDYYIIQFRWAAVT